ncbi:MAG: Flp pilus assembly complex ATPase component TadA [Planctomycetes bacterium]|nr:Flp pilus assembly complex ATPase component TadA [Planctomycetota bacterium]
MPIKDKFYQRIRKVLLKHGVIEEVKADEAVALAEKDDAHSYADILLERGFVDEEAYLSAIAIETNLPPVDVEKVTFDGDALGVLSQELASYYGVLPVSKIGNILTVAVGNPFDILKLDDVRTLTNCDLRPVVSTERTIKRAIQKAYNPDEAKMDQAIQALKEDKDSGNLELKKESEEEQIDLSEISDEGGESPVIKLVNMLIVRALKEGASDIHIEPYEKNVIVRYRQDGVLREAAQPPKSMVNNLISRIKIMSSMDIAERRIPQDGKFQVKFEGRQVDFRVSILPTIFGEKAVLRVLDSSKLNLGISQLGFEPEAETAFRRALAASYGMVLVTGPTGSGKSTTLYASLREVLNPEENVCTVEEPVEYQLDGVIQVPVNPKRGLTFAVALRSLLRQDPDTIMIGEIRDFETADIAVKAALTGHLVFSTLHTNDAPSSISRLVDMGIDPFMVSSSLILVAAQRLCRKLCDRCKAPLDKMPLPEDLLRMGCKEADLPTAKFWRAVGCNACSNGYRGRFAILEALEVDDDIKKVIVERKPAMDIKKLAIEKKGMLTLRRCGLLNAMRGRTSLEEVLRMTMTD